VKYRFALFRSTLYYLRKISSNPFSGTRENYGHGSWKKRKKEVQMIKRKRDIGRDKNEKRKLLGNYLQTNELYEKLPTC